MHSLYTIKYMTPSTREARYKARCERKRIEEQKIERNNRYKRRCSGEDVIDIDTNTLKREVESIHSMVLRPRVYSIFTFFGF